MQNENQGVLFSASRREFIASGTVAGAAALLSPGGVMAAGDENIRLGLIGCGGRGSGAAKDCLTADKSVKLVAVADAFRDRAEGAVDGLKKNKQVGPRVDVKPEAVFVGLDAYQKLLDSGLVDLVILATPPGFRPYHLEAAIKADKHVFCEKPVAVDAPGIRKCYEVYEEALKKKKVVVAGTQRRHQKGYIETLKQVQDGAIGDIVSARCSWNGDGIWFNKRQDGVSDVVYQLRNWYHFVWLCGDQIVEQHVHNLDVINWAMGAHPIRATGIGGRSPSRPGGATPDVNVFGHIFDHFAVEYDYPNGVRMFSYCRHFPNTPSDISETLIGTKGVCKVNEYSINKKRVGDDDENPYVQEHIDLIKAIRSGTPLNELKNVADSTMTAILGRMVTYTGQPLTWSEALQSKDTTMPSDLTFDTSIKTPAVAIPGTTKFV